MRKSQILIHQQTLEQIADRIKKEMTVQQIKQAISWDEVKQSAIHYLTIMEALKRSVELFQEKLQKMHNMRHNELTKDTYTNLPKYITLQRSISRFLNGYKPDTIYKSTIAFQTIINSKLGQKMQSIVVWQNKKGDPVISQFSMKKYLKYNYSSSNKINASINLSKTIAEKLTEIEYHGLKDNQLAYLQFLYKDMDIRYDIGQETGSQRIMWYNPSPPPKWKKRKLQSKGSLNQAYASLILERRYEQNWFNDYRIDVDRFMETEISRVDNISGLLKGDAEDGAIQYVIKSLNASFMGLSDIMNLAREIVGKETILLQEILEEEKERLNDKGSMINQKSEQALEETISKSFIDFEQQQYQIAMNLLK